MDLRHFGTVTLPGLRMNRNSVGAVHLCLFRVQAVLFYLQFVELSDQAFSVRGPIHDQVEDMLDSAFHRRRFATEIILAPLVRFGQALALNPIVLNGLFHHVRLQEIRLQCDQDALFDF
ncbi:MAG: hypothetical protein ABL901_15530 [Hyphomicrobiaceae bacterium]